MKVAAYDIGTHSTRLLVAEIENDRIRELARKTTITRLGDGIANKTIGDPAIERTVKVLKEYKSMVDRFNVVKAVVVTTSAVRDAKNTGYFTGQVQKIAGVKPSIISGRTEGELTFQGVCSDLTTDESNKAILVIDIGGGSTELILGSRGKVEILKSLDAGCLRMKEQFLRSDPPEDVEIKQLLKALEELFKDDILEYKNKFQIAIAVAGTSTSLAAIKLSLKKYDRLKIHRTTLFLSDVEKLNGRLSSVNLTERKKILGIEPERADVIVSGGLILEYLMKELSINKVIVFESDILDGLALSLASN